MKLTAILLTVTCLSAAATGHSQLVTLKVRNVPLKTVFVELNKQTGYNFLYSDEALSKAAPVSIDVKDESLKNVLALCFQGQPLEYMIENDAIVVKQKPNGVLQLAAATEPAIPPLDISGKVTDKDGNPLQGATISVKGNDKLITRTDVNGVFVLKGLSVDDVLVISYAEYKSQSIKVGSTTSFSVKLEADEKEMGEVIIKKGYYDEKQKYTVGNSVHIDGKVIDQQPVQNVFLALQGRVPGLSITQNTGLPGSGVTVRLQGESSISSAVGKDPLYVVDGVPISSQLLPNFAGVLGASGGPVRNGIPSSSGSPLNYLNPNDIESIDVLKDADATAIYGSRAANGAILITTKKGKTGKTSFGVNVQKGWSQFARKLPVMNLNEYLNMRREAKRNENAPVTSTDYDINGFWDSTRSTDWQDVLLGKSAHYTDVQAAVSGGNANTKIFMSTGYHKESTVFRGDFSDKKGSFHIGASNTSYNQKFRMELTGNYMFDQTNL
ncbi:MAG TPA: TonB-dependent receptor plug domain-containing protein, partial [Chitinophagaceae bacterium]|nr:TonB-dependent receptor plug domain-containing protein [Chitinophagaceae bacterium]